MSELVLATNSAAETEAAAAALAAVIAAGDRVFLDGGLGAGKTTFTRGFVRGLGHPDPRDVASPTFALHHRYEGGRLPVDHLDLYRLEDAGAARIQGVLDAFEERDAVTLVEWPERLPRGIVEPSVVVSIAHLGPEGRILRIRIEDHRASRLAAALSAAGFPELHRA